MSSQSKNVTYWIVFLFVALSTFGIVYQAIASTNKEIQDISNSIASMQHNALGEKQSTTEMLPKNIIKSNTTMDQKQITKATFKTNYGDIEVTFRKETPVTVENFTTLAKEGFYNGTRFHRVIKNFMIQGGDPKSKDSNLKNEWGTGGPGYMFKDEVFSSDEMNQGVLAMANAGPGTNGSQFFIVTAPQGTDWLVGKHTIFGKVTRGLDVALAIEDVPTAPGDRPVKDVIVESITLQ